jgi:tetratricopeptide (TPR) repeat protein
LARVSAEVAARQLEAKRLAQKSPGDALALLDELAKGLGEQPLPEEARDRLLRRIERTRQDIEEATGKRRAELALEKQNEKIEGDIDRERARQRLDSAVGIYSGLLAERPRGLIAERGVFGLAKARESLGQLEEARRGYEAVVSEYPESAVRGIAENRIAALSRESTRQWYDWFDGWKPAPAKPAEPASPAADKPAEPAAAGAGTDAGG